MRGDPLRSYEPPKSPSELSTDIVSTLGDYSPARLGHVAGYAEKLADHKQREARLGEEDEDEVEARPDDLPDDVPSKAATTIKEINDNRYYYWQWRDGDNIPSQYKGPVHPSLAKRQTA